MSTKLQSHTPEEYGDKYQDHLLEQYKLFVETSQAVTEKRQTANNYLLTLCSSLVTLFVTFLSTFGHHRWNALIPIAGIFVCFIWWSLVNSYKALNTAKFKVIHEMEEQLPVAPFDYEWHVCGKGKDRAKYVPLTHLERLVPWLFGILFVVLVAYALLAPVDKKREANQTESPIVHALPSPSGAKECLSRLILKFFRHDFQFTRSPTSTAQQASSPSADRMVHRWRSDWILGDRQGSRSRLSVAKFNCCLTNCVESLKVEPAAVLDLKAF